MAEVIYLDSAASTAPFTEVLETYCATASNVYANPASGHGLGKGASLVLERARSEALELLKAGNFHLVFTSGATESNNWMLRLPAPGSRVVISAVEHASVQRAARAAAEKHGYTLEILPVKKNGELCPDSVNGLIANPPDMLALMAVNNETGIVYPVQEISHRLQEAGAKTLVHVDAVHAVAHGFWPEDLSGIASLSLSGHKFHGIKGCGMLLLSRDRQFEPLLFGGDHEHGLRPGTPNVPGAVATVMALRLVLQRRNSAFLENAGQLRTLLRERLPVVQILGDDQPRVPWICMLAIPGMRGDALVRMLDYAGVEVSSGSACSTGKQGLSPTLAAMKADFRSGHVRFSLDVTQTPEMITEAVSRLADIVERYQLPPLPAS